MRCPHCGKTLAPTTTHCDVCRSYAVCQCGVVYWCSCMGVPYDANLRRKHACPQQPQGELFA